MYWANRLCESPILLATAEALNSVLPCILTVFRHKKESYFFVTLKDFQSFALPTELWHRVWFGSAKVRVILDFAKFSAKIGENRRNAYLSGCTGRVGCPSEARA